MEINIKELAKKSLLEIKKEEESLYKNEITEIINSLSNLPELEETPFFLDKNKVMELRKDVIKKSIPKEDILVNGPEIEASCFSVPKIMDE